MSANYKRVLEIAILLKKLDCIVIIGGPHISSYYNKAISNYCIDIAVIGEGEKTLLYILNAIYNKYSLSNIKGIAFKENNKIIYTGNASRINNLDNLPLPDYENIDMKPYIALESLGLISSRGCPNSCIFCSSKNIWGHSVIFRSAENVIKELDYFKRKYKYNGNELIFYDDNLTLNKERLYNICNLMIKKNYQYRWKCMSRIDTLDKNMLIKMKQAGCFSISFGIESANEETLLRINKNITINEVEKIIKTCNDIGVIFHGYFIIGFPWETKYNFKETIDFILKHQNIEASLSVLNPYPGTDFYENKDKWNIQIDETWNKYNQFMPIIKSKMHTDADIYEAFSYYLIYQERKYKDEAKCKN